MTKSIFLFCLFVITFSACSDEIISDQIADNYTFASLSCPELEVEEEFQNVEVSQISNGDFEIELGTTLGILKGTISDESEISMQAYQGISSSGVNLDLPFGIGDFFLVESENGTIKSINIRFQTPVERLNVCSLILNKS